MGSGLILLVIVGAWLAVLVPMALRSHDSTSSLSSVDRFSDAMRVLSRREGSSSSSTRSIVVPPRPVAEPPAPAPVSLAVRRRRTLLGLLGVAGLSLLGSLVVGPLLWVHLLADLLAVAFVVHCRRQQQLKAARDLRSGRATARRATAAPAGAGSVRAPRGATDSQRHDRDRPASSVPRRAPQPARVAGIPERMPSRPAPLTAPLPAPAARHFEQASPVPASAAPAAALGEPWSPVPVPVPTYVTKPVAPPRRPRVLDLTRPGEWTAALQDDAGLGILDDSDDLESILDRAPHRRAVGD